MVNLLAAEIPLRSKRRSTFNARSDSGRRWASSGLHSRHNVPPTLGLNRWASGSNSIRHSTQWYNSGISPDTCSRWNSKNLRGMSDSVSACRTVRVSIINW